HYLHTGRVSQDVADILQRDGIPTTPVRRPGGEPLLLAGMLFPPADLTYQLMERRIPHYPFGILDGHAVAGPLVLPGHTPCLSCLDHLYLHQDALWRSIRLQAAARPTGTTHTLSELLGALVRSILLTHLDPWRQAACPPAPLSPELTQRISIAPHALDPIREPIPAAPDCPGCELARA
ncbi:hypothetical protein DLJ54_07745, partial [Corynebacterium heidelbergense]